MEWEGVRHAFYPDRFWSFRLYMTIIYAFESMKCYATDAMSSPRSKVKLLVKNLRSTILFCVKKFDENS